MKTPKWVQAGIIVLGSSFLTYEVYGVGYLSGATYIVQKQYESDKEMRFVMQKMMKACDGTIINLDTDNRFGRDLCESDPKHKVYYLYWTPFGYVLPDETIDPVSKEWHKPYDK